jgi:hypothetical protein
MGWLLESVASPVCREYWTNLDNLGDHNRTKARCCILWLEDGHVVRSARAVQIL